ncbi:MAG: DUF1501 domain-containing protein, partial [Lentisphaerales bacterium]|nr:DUF1501 domain-containing protein [Lentisphaerales bacterium]
MNKEIFNTTRRQFLMNSGFGLGAAALGMMNQEAQAASNGVLPQLHLKQRAKRVIFLCMSGGPSQHDLFDYKPSLAKLYGKNLADYLKIPRLSGMTAGKSSFPIAPSKFEFKQHGQCGHWMSELLPYTAKIADDISIVKSMTSTHVNHDPAVTFLQTGHPFPGRPSIGAWSSYGLGSLNKNLPDYITLTSQGNYKAAQPLLSRLWGSGFLPSKHQGIKLRSGENAVLHLKDPAGHTLDEEKIMLNAVKALNNRRFKDVGDREIQTRISQYEMAFKMQTSVP